MPKDPDHIDDVDNPEWTEAASAMAVPFEQGHPEFFNAWKRRRGRPTIDKQPKIHVGFRLAADVVNGIKATGRGYNARVERVLREALAKGRL